VTGPKPSVELSKALRIISRAWGKQDGYVFFPHIDRAEQARVGLRRAGYHENRAFKWPEEKAAILEHMAAHTQHDLYWCPSIFEGPDRQIELAMDEHALWADLDEADPRLLNGNEDFKPTVAWQSSPGRFQGLWLGNPELGDFQGASWSGQENQRLTYYLDADKSGWDTTQLLRIPGWPNHKPENAKNGKPPIGKLLWERGPLYEMDDFKSLPEVKGALTAEALGAIIESDIDGVDRHKVIDRVKLKLNQRARELLAARNAAGPQGTRGDNLWYLIRCLADVGCTVQEIVAVARGTVWNKFEGRGDEIKRLITEATKAIGQRSPETEEALEELAEPKPKPMRIALFLKDVKPPTWLVEGIATWGSMGFLAGQPKSYKSWMGLDLGLSIATGADFLDYFRVVRPGPVLYIQEEDPAIMVNSRVKKIWRGKTTDRLRLMDNNQAVLWEPGSHNDFDPDINIVLQSGFIASQGDWQEWLDETLAEGMDGRPYHMVIIDTLMNVAGDVDENKSQQMTSQIYKPMKLLMRKHDTALRFIHHMGKGGGEADSRRGGQKMLGGTANHAWSEDSLYVSRLKPGYVSMEFESKSAPGDTYTIGGLDNKGWTPFFEPKDKPAPEPVPTSRSRRSSTPKRDRGPDAKALLLDFMSQGGAMATQDIATALKADYHPTYRRLRDLKTQGLIVQEGKHWRLL
jgi:hypothetical protein